MFEAEADLCSPDFCMTIGNHILAALDGPSLSPLERDLILKHRILGFTLFKRNIQDVAQIQELNDEIKSLARQAGYKIILAIDHEGGRVFRLPEPFTKIPPMREWGAYFDKTGAIEAAFELGKVLGSEAGLAGFNLNFAPVVDVDLNDKNPVIGDRAFSKSPEAVYKLARQIIRGLASQNIAACLKHFPGHGATNKDSHKELPSDSRSQAQIEATDLYPYQQLIKEDLAPSIMTAHVVYPNIDAKNPATLSHKIITGMLREGLKFDGVIFSDDLLMKAIANNYDLYAAALEFILAGGDALLICKKPEVSLEIIERFKIESKSHQSTNQQLKITTRLTKSRQRLTSLMDAANGTPSVISNPMELLKKNQVWAKSVFTT